MLGGTATFKGNNTIIIFKEIKLANHNVTIITIIIIITTTIQLKFINQSPMTVQRKNIKQSYQIDKIIQEMLFLFQFSFDFLIMANMQILLKLMPF